MNSSHISVADARRSRLRTTVATLQHEVARLQRRHQKASGSCHNGSSTVSDDDRPLPNDLAAALADLVEQLALGPEPEVRECPVCRRVIMRAATRCGYCWTRLTPQPL